MRRSITKLALAMLVTSGGGCGREFEVPDIEGCTDRVVCSLTVLQAPIEPAALEDGSGVSVELDIEALVPRLKGGARASLAASTGTLVGASAEEAAVFLAPVGLELEGYLQGAATLQLPYGKKARVRVELGDAIALTWVGPYTAPEEPEEPLEDEPVK